MSQDNEFDRLDDDLLREEIDAQRREDESEQALECALAISAAAESGIRRDQRARIYGGTTHDTAPDGRPLYIGSEAYEQWVKTDKRGNDK